MSKKTDAEKVFEKLAQNPDFEVKLVLGRRNHKSIKEIKTLRLNKKGRVTIPDAISEKKLFLSEFGFYKVGFDKKKLYILFTKKQDEKAKKFLRYRKKGEDGEKGEESKTCYLELGPQLRVLGAKFDDSFDIPIELKETKKGLLVLNVSLLFPAT